jgi:hypothetical protein
MQSLQWDLNVRSNELKVHDTTSSLITKLFVQKPYEYWSPVLTMDKEIYLCVIEFASISFTDLTEVLCDIVKDIM